MTTFAINSARQLIESSDVEEKDAEFRRKLVKMVAKGVDAEDIAEEARDFSAKNHPEWWTHAKKRCAENSARPSRSRINLEVERLVDRISDTYNILDLSEDVYDHLAYIIGGELYFGP